MDTKEECYLLMVVHWFDRSTHIIDMIDTPSYD